MILPLVFFLAWFSKQQITCSNDAVMDQSQKPRASALTALGPSLAVKKLCRLPSEAGVCSESIKRYYYSAHSRHCVEFVYGGCNGNENNFDNITECEDTCQGVLPCPYVAWVPGCTLKQNGEDGDGCQTYEMTCEPAPSEKDKKSTTVATTIQEVTPTRSTIGMTKTLDLSQIITVAHVTKLGSIQLNESDLWSTTNFTDWSNSSSINDF